MRRYITTILLAALPVLTASGQMDARNKIEVGALSYSFDGGISPWRGVVVRTELDRGRRMVWNGEAVAEHRFGEPSFAYKLQHAADFGNWITRVAARTSNGGFYNPKLRVDAALGAKVLPGRKLIVMVGGTYRDGRDGHQDTALLVEGLWYLRPWLVAQGSVRFQQSNPGNALSRYHDAALTFGRPGKATVVLHAAAGSEAYQIVEPLVIYTDFNSQSARVGYRQWFSREAGVAISGSYYTNPYYHRVGVELSLFFGFNAGGR